MSRIDKWVDENEMPNLSNAERLIALLYDLGIASLDQLVTLTNWNAQKVNQALHDIRNRVPIPEMFKRDKKILAMSKKKGEIKLSEAERLKLEASIKDRKVKLDQEREKWLVSYQAHKTANAYYTLGVEGIRYATAMRHEPFSKWKVTPRQQTNHYYGLNEILVRLRKAGVKEQDWLCGRETEQELYYYFNRYKKRKKLPSKTKLYYRPDAYLVLNNQHQFFIEYDTGSESPAKLKRRFINCLKLYQALAEIKAKLMPPIVWVTVRETRKKLIEEIAKEVRQDYIADNKGQKIITPASVCFVEGEDTEFFAGEIDPKPFWS